MVCRTAREPLRQLIRFCQTHQLPLPRNTLFRRNSKVIRRLDCRGIPHHANFLLLTIRRIKLHLVPSVLQHNKLFFLHVFMLWVKIRQQRAHDRLVDGSRVAARCRRWALVDMQEVAGRRDFDRRAAVRVLCVDVLRRQLCDNACCVVMAGLVRLFCIMSVGSWNITRMHKPSGSVGSPRYQQSLVPAPCCTSKSL